MLYRRQTTNNIKTNSGGHHERKFKDTTKAKTEAGYEASKFALQAVIGWAALIGLWGFACLIGGLATNGFGEMLRGFWMAVTGS